MAKTITVLNELGTAGSPAKAVLVTDGERYFRVSSVIGHDTDKPETLVFACDEHGEVEKWTQMAGGIGQTRSQAIADLEHRLNTDTLGSSELIDAFNDEIGGPIGVMCSILDGVSGMRSPRGVDDDFLK